VSGLNQKQGWQIAAEQLAALAATALENNLAAIEQRLSIYDALCA
jgi:hypothetical protein